MDTPPSLLRRVAGLLLGLFVLGQLFFLLSGNLLRMFEDAKPKLKEVGFIRQTLPDWSDDKGRLHAAVTTLSRADRRWGELTAQPQSWSLFAPSVFEHIPFPAVLLRWSDEQRAGQVEALPDQLLPSANEPPDRHCYFRYGLFRLRRYEGNVGLVLPQGMSDDARRGKIEEHLREEVDCIHAYLRWRLEEFRHSHPELPPPREVILLMNTYRIPSPPGPEPWDWQVLERQPVVRWRPDAPPEPEYLLLEMYNPVMNRFERLRKPS